MSFRLREIIKDPDKRAVISWLGGGAVVVAAGIWTVFTFVVEHKDASDKKGGTNITVSGQGIVAGRDTNITGPSKEQIEQIQKPLTEQLGQKDTQIAALTKMLLEKIRFWRVWAHHRRSVRRSDQSRKARRKAIRA